MNPGKNRCEYLKEVRRRIATENDIPLEQRECTFQGECSGTCPFCEAELHYLETELHKRRTLGKVVPVTGSGQDFDFQNEVRKQVLMMPRWVPAIKNDTAVSYPVAIAVSDLR